MRDFVAAIIAVLSAFVGIRKRGAANNDQAIKPIHIVIAAVTCVGTLIAVLVTIVRAIV